MAERATVTFPVPTKLSSADELTLTSVFRVEEFALPVQPSRFGPLHESVNVVVKLCGAAPATIRDAVLVPDPFEVALALNQSNQPDDPSVDRTHVECVLDESKLTVALVSTPNDLLNWLSWVEPMLTLLVVAPFPPLSVTVAVGEVKPTGATICTISALADEAAKAPSAKAKARDIGLCDIFILVSFLIMLINEDL